MMAPNPFRETHSSLNRSQRPRPCHLVIFGATGDLTHRKLIPALYNLAADGELPAGVRVIGFARREKSDADFRKELAQANKRFSRQIHDETLWENFSQSISYHRSDFDDLDSYHALAQKLDAAEKQSGDTYNRLFYLASAPEAFETILSNLKKAGLHEAPEGKWARVIVEKPFGRDLKTARELNRIVRGTFAEADTYRIDHYLGKETAQNIMVLRFANAIFEPLWNNRHIDHVQISCAETIGVEGRGGYYDTAGALRDMVQNHLLQLLSLIAMEPPNDLSADRIRDEKVKVLRSLRTLDPEEIARHVVRGQYAEGYLDGSEVAAYRSEERVDPNSMTETYVALRILIDNWRWAGVPFYLRMGKRLPKSATEISLHFKEAPAVLFNTLPTTSRENALVIRIQPDEGFSLRIQSKFPGANFRFDPVKMNFHYRTSFGKASPEAYERLLLDAMAGDATLFARRDEVEEAWKFIDRIEEAWHGSEEPPPLEPYPAGTWGPEEADSLLQIDGRRWRQL